MRCLIALATAAALTLTGIAATDAAPRKKTQASDRAIPTSVKHKRNHVARPAMAPSQGWPTSYNDGSFSYSIGPGSDAR
jgi:hypothetical protein